MSADVSLCSVKRDLIILSYFFAHDLRSTCFAVVYEFLSKPFSIFFIPDNDFSLLESICVLVQKWINKMGHSAFIT